MRRIQAIDIGTNSVRSIVAEVSTDGTYRVVDDTRETVRLGEGLEQTGSLGSQAMDRTAAALQAMRDSGRGFGAEVVRAIATEALRRASNSEEFLGRVRNELGIEIEVIAPEEEGRFVLLSAAANLDLSGSAAIVDIGGGSVEIVQAVDGEMKSIVSLHLGARILMERFVDSDPVSGAAFERLESHVHDTLHGCVPLFVGSVHVVVCSGGTATSVAAIVAASRGLHPDSLQGFEVERDEVARLLKTLTHSTANARREIPGMPPDRIDIILPGTLVLAEVLELFGASSVIANTRGIREGVLIDMLRS